MMLGLALEAAGRVEEGRDVLLDLLERWNRPGERAQSIGHESFREIRDGGWDRDLWGCLSGTWW